MKIPLMKIHILYGFRIYNHGKMATTVLRLEDILKTNDDVPKKGSQPKPKAKKGRRKKGKKETEPKIVIPKGEPVSGRIWKSEKKRFSSIIKTRGYKVANKFEKLQARKKEINRIRDLTRTIVEDRKRQIEEKKERRRLNLQRKEENRLKSEVVQIIKNPAKIKRLRKKQLRSIQKRDTLNAK